MKYTRHCIGWSLLAISFATIACNSTKEGVPETSSEELISQDKTDKAAPPVPYDPDRVFGHLDHDGDQTLDLSEFSRDAGTKQSQTRKAHVFHALDRNQDGRVSPDEFRNLSPEADFREKDKDSDGVLSFDEFYEGEMSWAQIDQARRVFDLTDRDKSGTLIVGEFGNRPPEAWFVRSDQDGDDFLSLAEYGTANGELVQTGRSKIVFDLIDRDHDGRMALTEFVHPPIEEGFYKRDKDGDDALSLIEFSIWCNTEDERGVMAAAFQEKDYDENGLLSLTEYKVSPAEADFRRLDSDRDGKLGLEEFAARDSSAEAMARSVREFSFKDVDGDERLSREEYLASPDNSRSRELGSHEGGRMNHREQASPEADVN